MQHVAVYVRFSRRCRPAGYDQQLPELQQHLAATVEGEAVIYYQDAECAGPVLAQPQLDRLLQHVADGQVSRVICWKLCRLAQSPRELSQMLALLESRSVPLLSLREAFDTTSPSGAYAVGLLASLAEGEAERVLDDSRSKVSTRKLASYDWDLVERLIAQGHSKQAIAKQFGLPITTFRKYYFARYGKPPAPKPPKTPRAPVGKLTIPGETWGVDLEDFLK